MVDLFLYLTHEADAKRFIPDFGWLIGNMPHASLRELRKQANPCEK